MAKKEKKVETYFEGLTFKEFKRASKTGVQENDIVWAGRLFPVFPNTFNVLSKSIVVFCAITIISLLVVWFSLLTRPPALLMAAYPNSNVICFPRLMDLKGRPVQLNKAYHKQCEQLNIRSGKMWQTKNSNVKSDEGAVGNHTAEEVKAQYVKISEMAEFKTNAPSNGANASANGGY